VDEVFVEPFAGVGGRNVIVMKDVLVVAGP